MDLRAQLVVDNTVNAIDGVQNVLLGPGVTASNFSVTGINEQFGSFTCNGCGLGIQSGFVMATGNVSDIPNVNSVNDYSSTPPIGIDGVSDPDLELLSNQGILNNTAVVEFDFVVSGNSLDFQFVFASDEYPEYVGEVNDAFGFFLSGPGINGTFSGNAENIALVPGTTTPVTINTVNGTDNSSYFISNDFGTFPIEFDGFTTVIDVHADVICGGTYHIKMAIGDASDFLFDSFVFLAGNSFTAPPPAQISFVSPANAPAGGGVYEGCDSGSLLITRPSNGNLDQATFPLTYSGSAVPGVDVLNLPATVTFTAGQTTSAINFSAVQDGVVEGTENLTVSIVFNQCGNDVIVSTSVPIAEGSALAVNIPNVSISCSENAVLNPIVTGGFGSYTYQWSTGDTTPSITVSPNSSSVYSLTVGDACNLPSVTAFGNVTVAPTQSLNVLAGPDVSITCLDPITISPNVTGGTSPYTYGWTNNNVPVGSSATLSMSDPAEGTIQLTVTDACDQVVSDQLQITFVGGVLDVDLGPDLSTTCIDTVTLTPIVTGSIGFVQYSWSRQGINIGGTSTLSYAASSQTTILLQVTDACGNTGSDQIIFNPIQSSVNLNLGADLTVNCSEIVPITAAPLGGIGNFNYQWYLNGNLVSNSPTYNLQVNSNSQLQLITTDQCGNSASDGISIAVPPVPIVFDLGPAQSGTCLDVFNLSANSQGGVGNLNYTWSANGIIIANGDALTWSGDTTTTVALTVSDQCGNTATDYVQIQIPEVGLVVNAGNDVTTDCLTPVLLSGNAAGGIGTYTWQWTPSLQNAGNQQQMEVQVSETTSYTLTVTDLCGNSGSDDVVIEVPPVPVVLSTQSNIILCKGEDQLLTAQATGGVGELLVVWNNVDTTQQYNIVANNDTTIRCSAVDVCGNSTAVIVQITIEEVIPRFLYEYVGDQSVNFINQSEGAIAYAWNFSDGSIAVEESPMHEFTTVGEWTATLTAISQHGCRKSITGEFFPAGALYIPNCFTPNEDAINEVFKVEGHDIDSFTFAIYNRWGDRIFYTTSMDDVWMGNAAEGGTHFVPDGIYIWEAKAIDRRGNIINRRGNLQIIR